MGNNSRSEEKIYYLYLHTYKKDLGPRNSLEELIRNIEQNKTIIHQRKIA